MPEPTDIGVDYTTIPPGKRKINDFQSGLLYSIQQFGLRRGMT
ncbi:hypothetical protein [Paenibacillus sp. N3/727]|nr:hypothetical protein [Paenibacillus sp. N3/727]